MIDCECRSTPRLCDQCLHDKFGQLAGTAACRGRVWAERVAKMVKRDRPWPAYSGRAAELALEKVADLTSDARLQALLAAECAVWAARTWSEPANS